MRARFRKLPSESWVWSLDNDDGLVLATSAVWPKWEEAVLAFELATGASVRIERLHATDVQGPDDDVVRDLRRATVRHVSASRMLQLDGEVEPIVEKIEVVGLDV